MTRQCTLSLQMCEVQACSHCGLACQPSWRDQAVAWDQGRNYIYIYKMSLMWFYGYTMHVSYVGTCIVLSKVAFICTTLVDGLYASMSHRENYLCCGHSLRHWKCWIDLAGEGWGCGFQRLASTLDFNAILTVDCSCLSCVGCLWGFHLLFTFTSFSCVVDGSCVFSTGIIFTS